jgi:hypothetical protein
VGSVHVIDNSLTVNDLGAGSVGSSEVADNSIADIDIATDAVGADEIAANAVGTSEIADNTVSTVDILDNSVVNADINAAAAIATSKIFGDAGVEYAGSGSLISWTAGVFDTQTTQSITMTIPTTGYVVVIHTGSCVFFGDGRDISAGVGTTPTAQTYGVTIGNLDGALTERYYETYTATGVFYVTAGTQTFYGNGWGNSLWDNSYVNMTASSLIGIFIPKRY